MKRPASRVLIVLLIVGVVAVVIAQALGLRQRLDTEHVTSAQDALDSIAASMTRACELGIPFDKLTGIDAFVRERLDPATGLTSLRLVDRASHLIWPQSIGEDSGRMLEARIGNVGVLQANLRSPDDAMAIALMAGVLIAVAFAIAIPLLELARWGDVTRRGLAARHLREQAEAIQHGDFRVVRRVPGDQREGRQLRVLRERVIVLNEQFQRVARLVGSLRRTEPDDGRRAKMGGIMSDAIRGLRFSRGAVLDRRVWSSAATARCFAVFIVLLANLALGDSSVAVASDFLAAHPSTIDELALWSIGLAIGAWIPVGRWQTRLTLGAITALIANLLFVVGNQWLEIAGCVSGGLATALASRAALEAGRARAAKTGMLLLVTSLIAAPVIGSAALSALAEVGESYWLYLAAAALTALTIAGLVVQLADQPTSTGSRSWRVRPAASAFLAGSGYSAALTGFIFSAGVSQLHMMWLLLAQVPAWLLASRMMSSIRIAPSRVVGGFALGSLASQCVLAAIDAVHANLTREVAASLILANVMAYAIRRRSMKRGTH